MILHSPMHQNQPSNCVHSNWRFQNLVRKVGRVYSHPLIRCSNFFSKFKVVRSVWILNNCVVLIILNLAQLISRETDSVCSQKHVLFVFLNRRILKRKYVGNLVSNLYCWRGVDWACLRGRVTVHWFFSFVESRGDKWHLFIGDKWKFWLSFRWPNRGCFEQ